ncbi:MAG: YihY/virulence factor BrkB family protein [Dehalococcoidia bacterium]
MIAFLKDVVNEFLTDNCPHLAASISYYSLLSLFPLTLALASVLGFLSASPQTQERMIESIGGFLPIPSAFITRTIEGIVASRGAASAIGTIGLLWGGSAVFNAIRKSLNTAWGIREPRNFLVDRGLELSMMIGVGLLLLISLGLGTTLSVLQKYDLTVFGIEFLNRNFFWDMCITAVSTGLAFLTFLFLYKVIPNTEVRWRDVWGGALLAAVGFEVTKQVFVWYTTNFAHYNLIYGSIGTIIALLVWIYISALILLFCAKVTSVYSRHRAIIPEEEIPQNMSKTKRRSWLRGLIARFVLSSNGLWSKSMANKPEKK